MEREEENNVVCVALKLAEAATPARIRYKLLSALEDVVTALKLPEKPTFVYYDLLSGFRKLGVKKLYRQTMCYAFTFTCRTKSHRAFETTHTHRNSELTNQTKKKEII